MTRAMINSRQSVGTGKNWPTKCGSGTPGYTAEAAAEIIVPKDVPDFISHKGKQRSIRKTLVNDVRRKIRPPPK